MQKQNINKYSIRTDLAIELVKDKPKTRKINDIKISSITLDKKQSKIINKKPGTYITIEFPDITDYDNNQKITNIFSDELKKLLNQINISETSSCLIIGLGNEKVTPDAVGPLATKKTIVTNHLYVYDELEKGFRRVSALSPGVMGETGIETSDIIQGIISASKPDFVIVIDALASSSIERVNKTIQMTDAGINPGSGVGNKRKEISKDTLNIPVIAIGVPTVVDAASIVNDTIHYMYKKFTNKTDDKQNLFGIVGSLSDEEIKQLIYEVLNPTGYNLMVTPKEEDFIVEKMTDVIANGINKALHKNVD